MFNNQNKNSKKKFSQKRQKNNCWSDEKWNWTNIKNVIKSDRDSQNEFEKKNKNESKLTLILNQMKKKFSTIEKQNVNQSIKTKTYANVIKAIIK